MSKESSSAQPWPRQLSAVTAKLKSAIEALAAADPALARAVVQQTRELLDDAEGTVIRAALERCHWRLAPAAELLGYPRHSALQKLVQAGRRHESIGKEIADKRDASGYHGGRPAKIADDGQKIPPKGQKTTARRDKSAP